MFQFQDLEEKNEVVKNAFLYLLDKSAGKGMLHAYLEPLYRVSVWDPVPYRQELARLNILTSVLFTYLNIWSHLHFFQLRSQTTKPRHRERMRKLNKSLIYAFKNPMSGTYPGLVLSFWAVQNRYVRYLLYPIIRALVPTY
jgi:hypothetical protein